MSGIRFWTSLIEAMMTDEMLLLYIGWLWWQANYSKHAEVCRLLTTSKWLLEKFKRVERIADQAFHIEREAWMVARYSVSLDQFVPSESALKEQPKRFSIHPLYSVCSYMAKGWTDGSSKAFFLYYYLFRYFFLHRPFSYPLDKKEREDHFLPTLLLLLLTGRKDLSFLLKWRYIQ